MLLKRKLAFLLLYIPSVLGFADNILSYEVENRSNCKIEVVFKTLVNESIQKSAEISENSILVLDEIEKLIKSKEPGKKLSEQMSPLEAVKYGELKQRYQIALLSLLVESRRKRDLFVMQKLIQEAIRYYHSRNRLPANHADSIYSEILDYFRYNYSYEKLFLTVPKSSSCNLESGLHIIENDALLRIESLKRAVPNAVAEIEEISRRYEGKLPPYDKLIRSDQKRVIWLRKNYFDPLLKELELLNDLEHIKILSATSEIMYELDKQDISYGGGELNKIGQSIGIKIKRKKFSEITVFSIMLWRAINELVPSEITKELSSKL